MGQDREPLIRRTERDRVQRMGMNRCPDVRTCEVRLGVHDRLEVRTGRQVSILLLE